MKKDNAKKFKIAALPALSLLAIALAAVFLISQTFAWLNFNNDINFEQDIMGLWFEVNLHEQGGEFTGASNINVDGAFPMRDPVAFLNQNNAPVPAGYQPHIYRFKIINVGTIGVDFSFSAAYSDTPVGEAPGLSNFLRFSVRMATGRELEEYTTPTSFGAWTAPAYIRRREGAPPNFLDFGTGNLPSTISTTDGYRHWAIVEMFVWLSSGASLQDATFVGEDGIRHGKTSTIRLTIHAVQEH